LFDLLFHRRLDVGKGDALRRRKKRASVFRITNFRQTFEQLREQPQQKRRVNFWRLLHQFFGRQDVDHTAALRASLDQIVEIEGRLAEEFVDPLRFELEQIPLNRARARG